MSIERYGTRDFGDGFVQVPFIRAGKWVFGTGLRAIDASGRLDASVVRPGRPAGVPPQAQREAAAIFEQMRTGLEAAGSSLRQVVRLDQYYPDARAVDPYHVARKLALANQVAPSTSVIVPGLLNRDASMDVQVMATTLDSGRSVERIARRDLTVPDSSGYAPCVRAGDLVFVAGQLARDASGAIAEAARVPAGQSWNGTRIRLETRYLVEHRLRPALEAAGSSMDRVLKAQVYLSHADDQPAFWQSWSDAFGGRVPPTTVVFVEHPAFGTTDATIEVNLIAVHAESREPIVDIECDVELVGTGMIPARSFDGLLFVAGLMALHDGGLPSEAMDDDDARYFRDGTRVQMQDILNKAAVIFGAAGSDLSQVVRALHFQTSLADFRSAYFAWDEAWRRPGLPFSAIRMGREAFVPGARIILDLWGHVP